MERWRVGATADHRIAAWIGTQPGRNGMRVELLCDGPRVRFELHDPPPDVGPAMIAVAVDRGRPYRLPARLRPHCDCWQSAPSRALVGALRTGSRFDIACEPRAPRRFTLRGSDAAIELATMACNAPRALPAAASAGPGTPLPSLRRDSARRQPR